MCKYLLDHGIDPNGDDETNYLICAVYRASTELVELLVKHGADVNRKAKDGSSALVIATRRNHVPIFRFLLENGADPLVQDANGFTPLILAAYGPHLSIFYDLLKLDNNDLAHRTKDGMTV